MSAICFQDKIYEITTVVYLLISKEMQLILAEMHLILGTTQGSYHSNLSFFSK